MPCDGKNCYLVATLRNQAATNLTETFGDAQGRMPERAFRAFLQRIQDNIPVCCQQALVQAVLSEVKSQANTFYSQHS